MAIFARLVKDFFLGGIYCYRWLISPIKGQCCRFTPSCSHYAIIALERHGVFYGVFLVIKRLLKCHPLNPGGLDHVP